MPVVLFAWQLGGGFGHLVPLVPAVRGLLGERCSVGFAAKDVLTAGRVFRGMPVTILQSPVRPPRPVRYANPVSYGHLLGNTGFGSDDELQALATAWRNLFRLVRPDVVVFDHSPLALFASRGLPFQRNVIGTGFCCPPDVSPFPFLASRSNEPVEAERLVRDESEMLDRANRLLSRWDAPPLERLGALAPRPG